eukprot:1451082-Rhodomonas_salina.2
MSYEELEALGGDKSKSGNGQHSDRAQVVSGHEFHEHAFDNLTTTLDKIEQVQKDADLKFLIQVQRLPPWFLSRVFRQCLCAAACCQRRRASAWSGVCSLQAGWGAES